jgi:hypothetical protein
MCDRLLRQKIYLSLLENEGDLTCNLTDSQWLIVRDLHILLKPFMIAQRLLEGEAYVTISLVPYIVYKIRKGLQQAIILSNIMTDFLKLNPTCEKHWEY